MTRPPANPTLRQERRRLELEQRRESRRRSREVGPPPVWRSPVVLFTVGALVIGLAIVVFALLQRPPDTNPDTSNLEHPLAVVPVELADGRTLGKADAPVTIDIWSDFQCPACREFAETLEPSLVTAYIKPGTVRLVYHDAAFQGARGSSPWDESVESAAGARCAADQGLFWQMHDWLFANWNGENKGAFAQDRLRAIASAAGLNLTTYDSCMAVGDKETAVRAETQAALAAGVDQTPWLIIGGQAFIGVPSWNDLTAVSDAAAGQQ